jgi:hypothetical protein
MVWLLIGLVILAIFLTLLAKVLDILLPKMGVDAAWKPVILGIIGLIVIASMLYQFGGDLPRPWRNG